MTDHEVRVRPARREDTARILTLIRELAAYEREPDAVLATPTGLEAALFAPDPRVHCLVAEAAGAVEGIAVWFVTFSTWTGTHGIWLEDLFVSPGHRGLGLGRALLASLAGECVRRGWRRLEWNVLDWNEPALSFYAELGAAPMADWTVHRLAGDSLVELATGRKV